ncbi:MAG: SDR family NAD(P)-dependent oxidoreductase, partial [Steroidobacteraceae bacterium]
MIESSDASLQTSPAQFDPRRHVAEPAELEGRIIAITGASDGIGRAVARACVLHGATVVLIGRKQRTLEAAQSAIESERPGSTTV